MSTPFQQPSPDFSMVTLKWAGNHLDGSVAAGSIDLSYESDTPMLDDDPVMPISIFPNEVQIPITITTTLIDGVLRTVGYIAVSVPVSNDPDILGSGGTYKFTENLNKGGGRKDVSFVADKDAPGGVIWLNKVAGTEPVPGEPVSVVYWSDFNALEGRVDTLEQQPDLTWSTLPGKPTTFTPSTHTHPASQVTDFTEAVGDAVAGLLAGASGVTLSYNDAGNTLTITGGGSGGVDAEGVRDAIGVALIGTGLISVVVNDALDTITVTGSAALTSALAERMPMKPGATGRWGGIFANVAAAGTTGWLVDDIIATRA